MPAQPLTEFGPPNNATTPAVAASLIAKASGGLLYGLSGYNNLAGQQWIQLFDSATLPADGTVPIVTFPVGANSSFSMDFGYHGREFLAGIVICNSTTAVTKTIGAANCLFDMQVQ